MDSIKISSKVDAEVWADLKQAAEQSHQSISGMLTDAIREYLARRRVRPEVMVHLEDSIRDNERLGELLAE